MVSKVLCVFENKAGSANSNFTLVTGKTKNAFLTHALRFCGTLKIVSKVLCVVLNTAGSIHSNFTLVTGKTQKMPFLHML